MKKVLMFAAAVLLTPVSQAQAAEIIGDTIACEQTNPSSIFTCNMSQAVVGDGREFTVGTTTPFIGLNFGGNGLRIRNIFGSGFTLGQTIIRLENLSQVFQSFSIANENIAGFNENDVTLANGVLTLDFRGTTWGANDLINLNLTATSAVPEPSTWMMLILGLGAIGASLRFQRRGRRVKGLDGAFGRRRQMA
jgi:PEP-CTERM motif